VTGRRMAQPIYPQLRKLPLQKANIVLDNRAFENATARIIRPVETHLSQPPGVCT
jgi:hypothetical protein